MSPPFVRMSVHMSNIHENFFMFENNRMVISFVQGGRGFIISDDEEVTGIISYKVNILVLSLAVHSRANRPPPPNFFPKFELGRL